MQRIGKGFALLFFGMLLMLMEFFDPWVPVIGDMPWHLLGLLAGIIGLIMVLTGGKNE